VAAAGQCGGHSLVDDRAHDLTQEVVRERRAAQQRVQGRGGLARQGWAHDAGIFQADQQLDQDRAGGGLVVADQRDRVAQEREHLRAEVVAVAADARLGLDAHGELVAALAGGRGGAHAQRVEVVGHRGVVDVLGAKADLEVHGLL
jgi:hypothetical protein